MPAILERLVTQLRAKGHDQSSAYAIATAALQRSGNMVGGQATAKGIRRGAMTPAARAKDRAAKYAGRKSGAYKYNKRRNIATLKRAYR